MGLVCADSSTTVVTAVFDPFVTWFRFLYRFYDTKIKLDLQDGFKSSRPRRETTCPAFEYSTNSSPQSVLYYSLREIMVLFPDAGKEFLKCHVW